MICLGTLKNPHDKCETINDGDTYILSGIEYQPKICPCCMVKRVEVVNKWQTKQGTKKI